MIDLPEGLSADARAEILALTEESHRLNGVECTESIIRHWCEALEDGNPLYLDESYARSQGFDGIVAPPAMNMTLAVPYRWPWPVGPQDDQPITQRLKVLLDLPVSVVVDIATEYVRFVEVGDRLALSQRLVSISPRKRTRMGDGHFWVVESVARNQRGDVVTRARMTGFGCNPHGTPAEDEATDLPGFYRPTEVRLEADRATHLPLGRHVCWEDVDEGTRLPTLVMPITVMRCVFAASATRDFAPHHTDREYAQQHVGARDMFTNTQFNSGMISRFVTEWAGPVSRVRALKVEMRENVCAGDDMIIDGHVVQKRVDGADHLVDVDIQVSTQHGPAYRGAVTVALPVRR